MRNIFDQYTQPENRVTHALASALHEDRVLLRSFLKDIAKTAPEKAEGRIEICEQTYPGAPEETDEEETEAERKGIPDAWITAGDDWCLLIENKVLSTATADQMNRHLATAKGRGFANPKALVLTILEPAGKMPDGIRVVEWRTVYRWLVAHASERPWAKHAAEFLELMEGRMVDQQQLKSGTLTAFNGIPFDSDNPFSYLEAKRVLGLGTSELRKRGDLKSVLGMDPDLPGRPAITGRGEDAVWDFLQINAARGAKNFTDFPHLTLGIGRTEAHAMITVPNGMRRESLRRLVDLGPNGFRDLVHDVLKRMQPSLLKCEGMVPKLRAVQRRYPTQKAVPFHDAIIEFDLRTGFDEAGPPKTQPQWLDAVYGCLAKKKSNFQFQIGAHFPYRTCPTVRSVAILDRMAEAWIACRPVVAVLVGISFASPLDPSRSMR
jgi:hypothetical protein